MIIQIRGTSGSGKTWVMRQVVGDLSKWTAVYTKGRKQPLYYLKENWALLGHYESACGGCDNIGSAAAVYDLIRTVQAAIPNVNILCEGLLLSEDTKWSSQLEGLRVLFLTTPLEDCIDQIKARRKAAGNEKPLNESNTTKRIDVVERARTKLEKAGIVCRRAPASQAVDIITKWTEENAI